GGRGRGRNALAEALVKQLTGGDIIRAVACAVPRAHTDIVGGGLSRGGSGAGLDPKAARPVAATSSGRIPFFAVRR
ncbi:MAG: hypothetical protein ACJARS_003678, partial [bacterium]